MSALRLGTDILRLRLTMENAALSLKIAINIPNTVNGYCFECSGICLVNHLKRQESNN